MIRFILVLSMLSVLLSACGKQTPVSTAPSMDQNKIFYVVIAADANVAADAKYVTMQYYCPSIASDDAFISIFNTTNANIDSKSWNSTNVQSPSGCTYLGVK